MSQFIISFMYILKKKIEIIECELLEMDRVINEHTKEIAQKYVPKYVLHEEEKNEKIEKDRIEKEIQERREEIRNGHMKLLDFISNCYEECSDLHGYLNEQMLRNKIAEDEVLNITIYYYAYLL